MKTTRMYGLRRRVWRVRRSVPRVARPASRVLRPSDPPSKPIFVIGCPRSGTSVLLRGLLRSPGLRSVQSEGHILWDEFHHPRDRGWDSDALGADVVVEREREYVQLAVRWFTRGRRFVDKTPENCLRIPYLESLFPDATFVFLRRRAADNVSSLIEGWRARPRFVKYTLPEPLTGLGPLSGNIWSFTLVPGWRDLRDAPLEVICARQYEVSNTAVLDARDAGDPSRWIDVRYEDLLSSPVAELDRLCVALGIPFDLGIREYAAHLADNPAATTVTGPRPDKWREQNPEAVARILPRLVELEARLGYDAA